MSFSSGASSLGSVFRQTDDSESVQVVKEAVKSGINYIDTAPWYGHGKSETVLGKVKVIPFSFCGETRFLNPILWVKVMHKQ